MASANERLTGAARSVPRTRCPTSTISTTPTTKSAHTARCDAPSVSNLPLDAHGLMPPVCAARPNRPVTSCCRSGADPSLPVAEFALTRHF